MFWMVNHMWHLAKYRIGLSTALGGTGMCIRTSIIKGVWMGLHELDRGYGIFYEALNTWS